MNERSSKKSSLAGFIAGCSTMVLFPLDKMKVYMIVSERQSRNYIPYYSSSLHLFKYMKEKGLRYMYRGFHLQTSTSIAWAMYFPIYEFFKKLPAKEYKESHYELYKFQVAFQSAVVGNFVSNPLFVIKTRALLMQNSENWLKDTIESLIKTWKVDGLRGFWRGYTVGLLLSFDGTLTMYLYETFKENLMIDNPNWKSSLSGGLSKVIACSTCFPIVLLKMRLQQEQYRDTILLKSRNIPQKFSQELVYNGIIDCVSKIWTQEGIKGFYRGLPITLLKVVPTNSLFFGVYELVYRLSV
jgi:solute carrier family 25 (mitochondrial folate transporter), member 32